MAKRPSSAVKTLSEANLAALGADRLAGILIEIADSDLKRRLRMELAAEVGAPDLALELDKRLNALAASRAKVSWRKRPALIADLQTLRAMIVGRLGPMEARLAFDRLVAWFDVYPSLAARVKDPKAELALIFDGACNDLAALASLAGPESTVPVFAEALSTRLSEWGAWVGRGVGGLDLPLATSLLKTLTHERPRPTGRLALVVRKLADRVGDLDLWIQSIPDDERRKPESGAEIARRLAQAGRPVEARAALEAIPAPESQPCRWDKVPAVAAPAWSDSWRAAEIAVLDAEGQTSEAIEARWSLFERTLSQDVLNALLAGLPDFDDVLALDRAFDIAAAHDDAVKGLGFLMERPALREAALMISARGDRISGSHDAVPLWASRLSARHPGAALTLIRARARALVRLGSGHSEEVEGLVGEAETLAAQVADPGIGDHGSFVAELQALAVPIRQPWR